MPTKFEFICEEHKEYGGLGWRIADKPNFDPLPGLTVAHDILEHFPNGDESPADELQAFGAMYYIRGETGYMQRNGNRNRPHEHMAADMPDIFRHIIDERMGLPVAPKTKKIDIDYVEEFIADLIKETARQFESEFGEHDAEWVKEALELLPRIGDWLRIGYRRAAKRFYGIKQDHAVMIFEEIEREADKYLKHANEGDKLFITPNVARGNVKMEYREGWEDAA